jgi:hypothetical protein
MTADTRAELETLRHALELAQTAINNLAKALEKG